MDQELIIRLIELLGTFAFAISGIRHAAAKQFDLSDMYWRGPADSGFLRTLDGAVEECVVRF